MTCVQRILPPSRNSRMGKEAELNRETSRESSQLSDAVGEGGSTSLKKELPEKCHRMHAHSCEKTALVCSPQCRSVTRMINLGAGRWRFSFERTSASLQLSRIKRNKSATSQQIFSFFSSLFTFLLRLFLFFFINCSFIITVSFRPAFHYHLSVSFSVLCVLSRSFLSLFLPNSFAITSPSS